MHVLGVKEERWGFSEVVPTLGMGAAGQMCTAGGSPDPALRPPPVAASLNWGGGGRAESGHALKHRNGAMEWGWRRGGEGVLLVVSTQRKEKSRRV